MEAYVVQTIANFAVSLGRSHARKLAITVGKSISVVTPVNCIEHVLRNSILCTALILLATSSTYTNSASFPFTWCLILAMFMIAFGTGHHESSLGLLINKGLGK